jgi:metallo-beta-lactamase family protein
MNLTLSFLGGAGTVTGSRFLLQNGDHKILVECGLFQGLKQLRLKNWTAFPLPPSAIGAVLLTHAHLDHSGYLPALVRDGFQGRIYASQATTELAKILLADSGHLQEQDAAFANRHGFSKHKPALPLYTFDDAERALRHLSALPFGQDRRLEDGPVIRLRRAGHILGAATIDCEWEGTRIVFSGDLGRFNDPIMVDPEPVVEADYLLIESTYGDRRHDQTDAQRLLGDVVRRTVARGGTVLIPAFAVGRTQSVLYHLDRLMASGELRNIPVFLDSPMAIDVTSLLHAHLDDHRLTADMCTRVCRIATYVQTVEDSKALTANPMPKVIISASGMAAGGRVLHHLKRYLPDRRNTVVFAGFQAAGTRGRAMVDGADSIKIHGAYYPVRAEIGNLSLLSAHADQDELLLWLGRFEKPPRMTFIVHGEPIASDALRHKIEEDLGWRCKVPEHLETVPLA